MARKGWDSLSAGYRARLERGGISKTAYDRGESLAKARGHQATPERPKSYNPRQYPKYHSERKELIKLVAQRKEEFFSASPKWNKNRSEANLAKYAPPMALLRWALDADYGEWIDAIRENPATYAFLGYH